MPGDFDTVKERVDIAQVIGSYVPLKKAGRIYKALCPFHSEKTPSFTVDPDRRTYKCFGCLPSGSLVKTSDGPRPIEQIVVDDLVYAGDGRLHRVLVKHEHELVGELVRLVAAPFKIPLLLTPDHKVPVLRPKSERIERVEAGSIRPQNYLLYPPIQRPAASVDIAALPEWFGERGKKPKPLPSAVGPELFAEWLGWYLAEGSVSNDRSIRFSLGGDELDVIMTLRMLTRDLFGEDLRHRRYGTKIEAWFCHALLSRWLKANCGDGAKNKRLPDFVWSWRPEYQWRLIRSLMLGDGSRSRGGLVTAYGFAARPSWSLRLASVRLVDEVRDLLLLNGVVPTTMTERTESDGRRSWSVTILGELADSEAGRRPIDGPLAVRIRRVDRVPYEGPVFNLTVEDEHTYLTMSGIVCNCGEGGDVFTFLEKKEGLSPAEALERLAKESGVELTRKKPQEREQDRRLYEAQEHAYFYFRQALRKHAGGAAAAAYLEKRGIRPDTVEKFGLGYAPDLQQGLLTYLRKKGLTDAEAVESGLVIRSDRGLFDRFRQRLMMPIRDAKGRPIAFAGRALRADQQAKYVNSPTTPLFEKSRVLFALDLARPAIRKGKEAIVVEGQFDAIAAHQAGVGNVVASMGTALTAQQYELVREMAARVTVSFDRDPAGEKAAEARGRQLFDVQYRVVTRTGRGVIGTSADADIFVAELPEGTDPDELVRRDPDQFRAAIAQAKPAVEFLLDALASRHPLGTPAGRRDYLREALPLLAGVSDPITRALYLDRLAASTGVSQETLESQLPGLQGRGRPEGPQAEGKQRATPERYVVAQLLRFPDQARRLELSPEDVHDPETRALFELVRRGERLDRYPPALAALRAELLAEVEEPASVDELVTAVEQAALRVRERRLRRGLEEARAAMAREPGNAALASRMAQLMADLAGVAGALERHTSLERATVEAEEE